MLGVVLVDDEFYIREMFKTSINWVSEGFAIVGEAASSRRATQLVRELQPHLVLLDINLPDADGFSIAQEILGMKQRTEIIIITGYDRFEFAKKAITYGVHDYLLKPVSDAELLDSVRGVKKKILKSRQNQQVFDQLTEDIYTLLPHVNPREMQSLYARTNASAKELDNNNHTVRQAMEYVQAHLGDPALSVEQVSRALFLNMTYLSHIFKKVSGRGLHEYILSLRMEQAYGLIMRTGKSPEEICTEVGFQSPVSLSKRLKAHYGMTFTQIRDIRKKYEK